MYDLEELYQDVVMDHNRRPRNFRVLEEADHVLDGYNPFCGDKVRVYVKLDGDVIDDVSFEGRGCAISRAAASLMTESVKGRDKANADRLYAHFHEMLKRGPDAYAGDGEEDGMGDLEALSGVAGFPTRVKCATLAWNTLHAALAGRRGAVSTE
jgi:nitrogen fixation NifU-like protein